MKLSFDPRVVLQQVASLDDFAHEKLLVALREGREVFTFTNLKEDAEEFTIGISLNLPEIVR